MSLEEYAERLSKLRVEINVLCFDVGETYTTSPQVLEKVLNDCLNGDLTDLTDDTIKTPHKIIKVSDFTR